MLFYELDKALISVVWTVHCIIIMLSEINCLPGEIFIIIPYPTWSFSYFRGIFRGLGFKLMIDLELL